MKKMLFISILGVLCASDIFAFEKSFSFSTLGYPPYISKRLLKENKSWVFDVVKAALEPQGYKVSVKIKPWKRAYEETLLGKYDGIYAAFWTKERLLHFEFSVPIGKISKGFFKRKNRDDIVFSGNLSDLKNYKIALIRGFATTPEFDKADYLKIHHVNNSQEGLKLLFLKRLDLMVASKEVDDYNLQLMEVKYPGIREDIIFMEPAVGTKNLYMAVPKKAPNYQEKLRDLNAGLAKIMLDGTYTAIKERHGIK